MDNPLVEKVAALEHEQWMFWSTDISKKEKLSPERIKRWKQFWKKYKDLPDDVKEHDRIWARKVILAVLHAVDDKLDTIIDKRNIRDTEGMLDDFIDYLEQMLEAVKGGK